MSENRKEHYNEKGAQDSSEGKYDAPHGIIDDLTTWSDHGMKQNQEDNDAYNSGWKNTDDQKKGNK